MEITRPASLPDFLARATPFLEAHEAEHGLMLGVAAATDSPGPDAYWSLALDQGRIVGAALRTATKLIVSRQGAPGAMAMIADDARSPRVERVLGPPSSVRRFVQAVGGEGVTPWQPVMSQGIYECRAVVRAPRAPGGGRVATPSDCAILAAWVQGFSIEALGETLTDDEAQSRIASHIAHGAMHVWEGDGQPVSLAAAVAPTPRGIRINHVYTPPEFRGRGFAGALVASLTELVLDSGREFAFLHTDLANPISNRLYVRIGYRHVADLDVAAVDLRA